MCFTRIVCDKKYYVRQFVITVITSIYTVMKTITNNGVIRYFKINKKNIISLEASSARSV